MHFCSTCCMCKTHKLSSQASLTTYKSPFELEYSDLWDLHLFLPSYNGFSYYISFVDAYSGLTSTFLLKQKLETITLFSAVYMVELQFNKPIKVVQTGWGAEFLFKLVEEQNFSPLLRFSNLINSFVFTLSKW